MTNQQQINDLLNDEWDQSSKITLKQSQPRKMQTSHAPEQQSNAYGDQQFQDYSQSKQVKSMNQSESQSMQYKITVDQKKKQKQQKNRPISQKLLEIKQQKPGKSGKKQQVSDKKQYKQYTNIENNTNSNIKQALDLGTESNFKRKTKMPVKSQEKAHIQYNYARLQQRQRQQLMTTIVEQNKKIKADLSNKQKNYEILEKKYKILLQEKVETGSSAKQAALQKQVVFLKTKMQQMANLQKIAQERDKYRTKHSKTVGNFIPQQQSNRRQTQLLDLIDKLKQRLLQSDQSMLNLQKKLNQGVEHNDQLLRKMRRVQQLEYKIEKMTEQAETDRNYINILKQNIKQLQKQIEEEKNKYRKLQIQSKRIQMAQLTHKDILKQLQQVKKQKAMLQKSLKDMSSTMINNVRKNYKNLPSSNIQQSSQLLKTGQK